MNKLKILFILFLGLTTASIFGQNTQVQKLFNKYSDKEGFTVVQISGEMIGLLSEKEDTDEELKQAMKGLNNIMILTVENDSLNKKVDFYKEIGDNIPWDEYVEIMSIKSSDMRMKMVVRRNDGDVSEFLMLGGGSDNFLISISGNVDLNNISKITDSMDDMIDVKIDAKETK